MSATNLQANPVEPLWDVKDVSAFLRVSRSWVYQHAEDGTLPCVRVGGLLRFIPAEIRRHVNAGRSA